MKKKERFSGITKLGASVHVLTYASGLTGGIYCVCTVSVMKKNMFKCLVKPTHQGFCFSPYRAIVNKNT